MPEPATSFGQQRLAFDPVGFHSLDSTLGRRWVRNSQRPATGADANAAAAVAAANGVSSSNKRQWQWRRGGNGASSR